MTQSEASVAEYANAGPREAFVLGAGFSRAISGEMPLTDDLGKYLAADIPGVSDSLGSLSFEAWLSGRAEPQPYLNLAANLERQALFARATESLARALDDAITRTLGSPMCRWLGELIGLWHLQNSDVLTFNYDTLVECAFETLQFWDWRQETRFQWGSLINYNPSGYAGSSFNEIDGVAPHPSFRLWKLHGSTNWFWTPGDRTGASARRVDLPGQFLAPQPLGLASQHWRAPGRERLLVPPSASKSPYYANPVTTATWMRGYEALSRASVITLIGYSLPATDLTTIGMLTEAVSNGTVREVRIVDVNPEPLAERLRVLMPDRVDVAIRGSGPSAVADYVTDMLRQAGRNALDEVRSIASEVGKDGRVLVTWGDLDRRPAGTPEGHGRTAAIVEMQGGDQAGTLDLISDDLRSFEGATQARRPGEQEPIAGADLLRRLGADVKGITVTLPGTAYEAPVIASTKRETNLGAGNGTWLQLIPAGQATTR